MSGLIGCTGLESAEVSGLRLTQPPLQRRFVSIRVDSWLTSCAGHRTRGHCALSAMLTVSQLSKSFAGQALFDDVSLQVNRGDLINFSPDPLTVRSSVFTFLPYGSDNYFSSDKKAGRLD